MPEGQDRELFNLSTLWVNQPSFFQQKDKKKQSCHLRTQV
jgi:hypothetical protein